MGTGNFNSRPSARGDGALARRACAKSNFNSRPSARGDARGNYDGMYRDISIHAPPRGATCKQYFQWLNERFQFTPLREGRRRDRCSARADGIFQFTPLREGRRRDDSAHRTPVIFQFTPLREGRRTHMVRRLHLRRISIHAPPRGATTELTLAIRSKIISIHAPPRGATKSEVRT